DAHAAYRTRYRQARRTAEDLGGQSAAADVAAREHEVAIELAQRRDAPAEIDAIAGEGEVAGDKVAIVVAERQFQLERELAVTAGLGAAGRVIQPLVDRAFGDEAQEIRGRSCR